MTPHSVQVIKEYKDDAENSEGMKFARDDPVQLSEVNAHIAPLEITFFFCLHIAFYCKSKRCCVDSSKPDWLISVQFPSVELSQSNNVIVVFKTPTRAFYLYAGYFQYRRIIPTQRLVCKTHLIVYTKSLITVKEREREKVSTKEVEVVKQAGSELVLRGFIYHACSWLSLVARTHAPPNLAYMRLQAQTTS